MKLIVGLGNPEKKYDNTRHNIGFMVVDSYAQTKRIEFKNSVKLNSLVYKDKDYVLLKPLTYMNNSGIAIKKAMDFYKIEKEDLLVIVDDFNIDFATLRLRYKGSAGGHNGLKSIIQNVGGDDFKRIRVGLGDVKNNCIDFVLSQFSKSDIKTLEEKVYPKTNEIIDSFIKGQDFDKLMNIYNVNES